MILEKPLLPWLTC